MALPEHRADAVRYLYDADYMGLSRFGEAAPFWQGGGHLNFRRAPSQEELEELDRLVVAAKGLAREKNPDPNGPLFMGQLVSSRLDEMNRRIRDGSFPRNYVYLPVVRENTKRQPDSPLYRALLEVNRWYVRCYRTLDPSIWRRERLIAYLRQTEKVSREVAFRMLHAAAKSPATYQVLLKQVFGSDCLPANKRQSGDTNIWAR